MKSAQYFAAQKGRTMRKLLIALIFIALGAHAPFALSETSNDDMLAPIDLSSPEATAYSMMRAMYQGDADMVDQVFAEGATLRRITDTGELRPDGLERWRDWVGTLETGIAHEVLFGVETTTFGNLATVWAPFTITVNGDLVGCGVNQLTMAQQNDAWRIIFGMDTNAPKETCSGFKQAYLARFH
ncbi:MAG: hypothetical protein AAGL97_12195 [Pseudomonadota bacterium]